jgi:hypothetical protein
MVNYIVSGLERSGTSLMMQILKAGKFPIGYDNNRKPDKNNPKGYFELYGGRIIDKLMKGEVNLDNFDGMAIKVTSYGLQYLPKDKIYKIIYMQRNYKEILQSQNKMLGKKDYNPNDIEVLNNINMRALQTIDKNDNMEIIRISYNMLMGAPEVEIKRLSRFLGRDISSGIEAIDKKLYRNRK